MQYSRIDFGRVFNDKLNNNQMNNLWLLCSKMSQPVSSKEMLIALHLSDLLLTNKIISFPKSLPNEIVQQANDIHQNELQKMSIKKKPEMKIPNEGPSGKSYSNEGEKLNKLLNQHKQLIEKEENFYESIIADNKADLDEIEKRINCLKSDNEKIENENKELENMMGALSEFLNHKLDAVSNIVKVRIEEKANLEREKVKLLQEKLKSQENDFNSVFESCLENTLANIDEHIKNNISDNKESQQYQLFEVENIFKQYDVSPAIVNLMQSNLPQPQHDISQPTHGIDEHQNENDDDNNRDQEMEYKQFDDSIDSKEQNKKNDSVKSEKTNSEKLEQSELSINNEHDQNILNKHTQILITNNQDTDMEETMVENMVNNKVDMNIAAETNQSEDENTDQIKLNEANTVDQTNQSLVNPSEIDKLEELNQQNKDLEIQNDIFNEQSEIQIEKTQHPDKIEEENNKSIHQEELDDFEEIENKSKNNLKIENINTNSNNSSKSDEQNNNDFDKLSINGIKESNATEANSLQTSEP